MTQPLMQDSFRVDIQGLRALAVSAVLLYHLEVRGFGGGYVGVDVFFVISGFLITGHLARDTADRRFSASRFYSRRIRRLLPLSALVLVSTIIATWFVVSPYRVRASSDEGIWVSLFASNFYFLRQATDYFTATTTPSVFQHYWSLAVEEQFYLIWPWLYLVSRALGRRLGRPSSSGALGIAVVICCSFAYAVWLMGHSQPSAFYLLPARAWELGAGGLLALSMKQKPTGVVANAGLVLGICGIAVSVLFFDDTTRFPGVTALLPVISTVLCLACGASASGSNPVAIALGSRPAQTIGRLSYSMYLWHWPLIVLAPAAGFGLSRPRTVVGLAVATIALSFATERWVERRFRFGRPSKETGRPGHAFGMFAGITSVCVAMLVLTTYVTESGRFTNGEPAPVIASGGLPDAVAEQSLYALPPNLYPPLLQARQIVPSIWAAGCQVENGQTDPTPCVVGERGDRPVVAIFGDSHMAMWEPSLEHLALAGDITLLSYSKSACGPYELSIYPDANEPFFIECAAWRQSVFDHLAQEQPDVVLVSAYWIELVLDQWGPGILATGPNLPPQSRVVLIGQTPNLAVHTPDCLAENVDSVENCGTPVDEAVLPSVRRTESEAARALGWGYVDPTQWLCADGFCPPLVYSTLLYMDDHHLTVAATELLRPQFVAAVGLDSIDSID